MASRYQRGSLRQETRKTGKVWMLRYFAIRTEDGKRVERTLLVGCVEEFPTKSAAWTEVERQGLTEKINNLTLRGGKPTFGEIAQHYMDNDPTNPNVILPKASTTQYCYKHVINRYLIERWGNQAAIEISSMDVERWLQAHATRPFQDVDDRRHLHATCPRASARGSRETFAIGDQW
jgi:hypothetical protein